MISSAVTPVGKHKKIIIARCIPSISKSFFSFSDFCNPNESADSDCSKQCDGEELATNAAQALFIGG